MNAPATPGQVERFRTLVANRVGLQFEDARVAWLADVLRRRMGVNGQPAEAYLARLQAEAPRSELGALAQELTVAETYFFRNIDQFHALREHVLPQRWHERGPHRCLRILSAGCASGEEAYSIAMTLRELPSDAAREASIRAVDLNPAVIDKARRARYTAWALRETSPALQQRWFRPDGPDLVLDDTIRSAVTFEERNLAEDDAELWSPGAYDLVFCRNVLMYFTPQGAQAVAARIARALAPGGYLFLGHAETLRGLSQAFHLRHTHGSLLIKEGVPVKVVSERLGHAHIAHTLETYQHVLPGMQADAARSTERLAKPVPRPRGNGGTSGEPPEEDRLIRGEHPQTRKAQVADLGLHTQIGGGGPNRALTATLVLGS